MEPRSSTPESFGEDSNAFALELYRQFRQSPGNLFFSPFSIRTVLSMAQLGARGETAAQMRRVLRLSSPEDESHLAFAEVIRQFNTASGQDKMLVANSLWAQRGAPLEAGFLELIAEHYGGSLERIDFRDPSKAAHLTINRWVEDKTRRMIRDLIPASSLNADTRLVLVNAVYFKGTWELQFPKNETLDAPFHLESGGTVTAPLMFLRGWFTYGRAGNYQALDLVYESSDLSMLILLPDRHNPLQNLESMLSTRMLRDCVGQMTSREVDVYVPRFRIAWGTGMHQELVGLGMPLAFSRSQADFSGINGHRPPDVESLFIAHLFHKALVEVNEEGTTAAAASAAEESFLGVDLSPTPIFRADHPFWFAIRVKSNGAIFFLGRITDPTLG
jgi:serpin B